MRSNPLFLYLSKLMVHNFQINPKQRVQSRYRLRNRTALRALVGSPDAGWRGDISSFSVGGDKSSGGSAWEKTANWTVCDPRAALKNCCHGSWSSSLRARLVYRFTDPLPGWSIVRLNYLFLHLSNAMVQNFQINPK